jgi:hypothetical protein
MWWLPLAMAAGKSYLDNRDNKQNIQSNIIKEKYSQWTGQHGDFSAQGRNSFGSNMLQGAAGAMMAHQAGQAAEEAAAEKTLAQHKSDGDWYAKNGSFMSPKGAVAKSSFEGAGRAPATQMAPAQIPAAGGVASIFAPQYKDPTPLMLQGPQPQQEENLWFKMMNQGGYR